MPRDSQKRDSALDLLRRDPPLTVAAVAEQVGAPLHTVYRWQREAKIVAKRPRQGIHLRSAKRRRLLREGRSVADVARGDPALDLPPCSESAVRQLKASMGGA